MDFALAPTEPRMVPAAPSLWDRSALRAVLFDVDDTLVDFSSAARDALTALIGRSDMWSRWEYVTDAHVAMVVAGEIEYEVVHRLRTQCFLADLGIHLDDDAAARFELRRAALMREGFRSYDDVRACLDWLRAAGIKIAVVTNASGAHQRRKLDQLGLSRFVDHVAIAGEVGAAKPSPLLFHAACAALDCLPAETLHIGDRLDVDAIGAHEAGMTGVWLDRGVAPAVERAEAPEGVHVINGLDELPELIVCEFAQLGVPAPRWPPLGPVGMPMGR